MLIKSIVIMKIVVFGLRILNRPNMLKAREKAAFRQGFA
jgi:hypothetical protein